MTFKITRLFTHGFLLVFHCNYILYVSWVFPSVWEIGDYVTANALMNVPERSFSSSTALHSRR